MKFLPVVVALFAGSLGAPVASHEFWFDSKDYQVEKGESLTVTTRNGQKFSGIDLAYFDNRVVRFERYDSAGRHEIKPRAGDSPVFSAEMQTQGLTTLVMQTTPSRVTYKEIEAFQKFVIHKDFGDVMSRHRERGLSEEKFSEVYTRYAKGLFAVGSGAGADAARGLEIEFIALKNPYTDDLSGGLPVKVVYREMPRVNTQVEVFDRAPDGEVTVTTQRTDAAGIAHIPVKSGHTYLLDNVVLREPTPAMSEERDAVWETVWASLTFAVP